MLVLMNYLFIIHGVSVIPLLCIVRNEVFHAEGVVLQHSMTIWSTERHWRSKTKLSTLGVSIIWLCNFYRVETERTGFVTSQSIKTDIKIWLLCAMLVKAIPLNILQLQSINSRQLCNAKHSALYRLTNSWTKDANNEYYLWGQESTTPDWKGQGTWAPV